MKHIVTTILVSFIMLNNAVIAQIQPSKGFCSDKKWNPVKYKEPDGKIYPIDDGSRKEYIILRCDGTFESAEDEGKVLLKGTWSWNASKKEITLISDKKVKDLPLITVTQVEKWTSKELVIVKRDGGNEVILIFFVLA